MELSTTSQTKWCRPRSPVVPMYMLGRLRTASSPSRTVMALASYAAPSGLDVLDAGALSASGRFVWLTSDTVLLWCHTVVHGQRDRGCCIVGPSGRRRQTSGVPRRPPCLSTWTNPRHLVRQAAESFFSLPVGADKEALRRPVSAVFR